MCLDVILNRAVNVTQPSIDAACFCIVNINPNEVKILWKKTSTNIIDCDCGSSNKATFKFDNVCLCVFLVVK